jgi:hypothetical protein
MFATPVSATNGRGSLEITDRADLNKAFNPQLEARISDHTAKLSTELNDVETLLEERVLSRT